MSTYYSRVEVVEPIFYGIGGAKKTLWTCIVMQDKKAHEYGWVKMYLMNNDGVKHEVYRRGAKGPYGLVYDLLDISENSYVNEISGEFL